MAIGTQIAVTSLDPAVFVDKSVNRSLTTEKTIMTHGERIDLQSDVDWSTIFFQ